MPDYESRVIAMVVSQPGKDLYDEAVTRIEIEDEAGGEFVVISQSADDCGKVKIDPQEWPAIRRVIDRMVRGCRG